jgi:predicted dehydrogenase
MNPSRTTSRREFLQRSTGWGAGLWIVGSRVRGAERSPSDRLNIGLIGVGGRGGNNLKTIAKTGENVVALCDVDEERLGRAAEGFPKAKTFVDFRKLLGQKDVDAVVVSTPDHTHAAAALLALRAGKHVYCEKPLCHSVHEARALARAAAETKLATQMGNTGHSSENTRRVVELIRAGAIGTVTEVHAWTNRPIWPQGVAERPPSRPAPKTVHWDLWLGPALERPYSAAYHPFKWRGWWDFGTGALGDMGCHIIDQAFWALDLRDPTVVEAESAPVNTETAPDWSVVRYAFPSREGRPALSLIWYDGGKLPPAHLFDGRLPAPGSSGNVFVGTKGRLLSAQGRGGFRLLPERAFEGFEAPRPTLTRSPGHHQEWVEACKSGKPTGTHFGYAGPLTELVLLGNVALRAGRPVAWDAANMRADHGRLDDLYLQRDDREGWSV